MSGKKGIPRYKDETKEMVVEAYRKGTAVRELSRQFVSATMPFKAGVGSQRSGIAAQDAVTEGSAQSTCGVAGANHKTATNGKRVAA